MLGNHPYPADPRQADPQDKTISNQEHQAWLCQQVCPAYPDVSQNK